MELVGIIEECIPRLKFPGAGYTVGWRDISANPLDTIALKNQQ
jgi:hypothetical protein